MQLKHLNLKYGVYKILDLISIVRLLGSYFVEKTKRSPTEQHALRTHEEQNCILIQSNAFHLSFFLKIFSMYNLISCAIFPLKFANQNTVLGSTSFIQIL